MFDNHVCGTVNAWKERPSFDALDDLQFWLEYLKWSNLCNGKLCTEKSAMCAMRNNTKNNNSSAYEHVRWISHFHSIFFRIISSDSLIASIISRSWNSCHWPVATWAQRITSSLQKYIFGFTSFWPGHNETIPLAATYDHWSNVQTTHFIASI